jgi:hypothetical protein
MDYSIYDLASGEILKVYSGPDFMLEANTPDGHSAILGDYDNNLYRISSSTHQPELKPIDTNQVIRRQSSRITEIRDQLRESPVTLADGWLVDADRDSVLQMQEREAQWGIGTATMIDGKQLWKGANNDVRLFTQVEFSAFVAEVREKRALKVDANFAYAESIRAQLPIPDDHPAFDPENWPG